MINFIIDRLDAIRAGDIGGDVGKTGSCHQRDKSGEVDRADHILDVSKGLSDTVCASAGAKG